MMRFGPGEEKDAATGACGSTVASVLSMVPTGLLQRQTKDHQTIDLDRAQVQLLQQAMASGHYGVLHVTELTAHLVLLT